MFKMALDILPIQASAVPCERVFSSSKETCTARRSHIDPDLMEALQLLKYHVRKGESLSFTEGLGRNEEETDLNLEQERAEKILGGDHTLENV